MTHAPVKARGFDDTKARARGQWRGILAALGVTVPDSPRRHVACPGCGGMDRFRFDDMDGDGTFLCSQGGAGILSGDGFRLLQHVRGWDEARTLSEVRQVLGLEVATAPPPADHALPRGEHIAVPDAATGDARPAFQFVRVGDLMGRLQPVDWLVRGFFEADSLALMFGDPGCGKSFLAFDVAACVATGTAWHGHTVKPGPVFVIAGEGNNGIARRFTAWSIANGVDLSDAPLFTSTKAASLTDPDSARAVAEAVDTLASQSGEVPRLIVIDTLARNFGGCDENSTADMGRFIGLVDEHLKARYRACVLIVHHTGHGDKTRARGSGALKGALDAEYSLTRDEHGFIRLEASKMKDAEPPQPQAFKLEQVRLELVDEEGETVTSCAPRLATYVAPPVRGKTGRGKNQTVALQMLRDLEHQHRERLLSTGRDPDLARVSESDWRDRLEIEHGIDRRRFHEIRKRLAESGAIVSELGGYVHSA